MQVLAVVQQATQAAVSDSSDDVQAASVQNVVEGCLCAHFRYALSLCLCWRHIITCSVLKVLNKDWFLVPELGNELFSKPEEASLCALYLSKM